MLLLACNGKNKEQDGTLTLYPLQNSHAIKDFSPYVESVEVIPLETTDSSLIANPSKIIITPEGNFVVNDASRNNGTLFKIMASDRHYFYSLHDDYDEYDNSRIRQIKDPLKRYILQKTHLSLKNENQNPALIKIKFKS